MRWLHSSDQAWYRTRSHASTTTLLHMDILSDTQAQPCLPPDIPWPGLKNLTVGPPAQREHGVCMTSMKQKLTYPCSARPASLVASYDIRSE